MAYKLLERREVGADIFEVWDLQVLWGRAAGSHKTRYRKNGKVIARRVYEAEVLGKAFPDEGPKGTCQICLRQIGIGNGHIAHHGYHRPGHGWQTSSCYGAKWRPLEVACDAIPPAIDSIERYLDRQLAAHESLVCSPPASLSRKDAYGRERNTYARPEGFDTTTKPVTYKSGYESLFWGLVGEIEANIRSANLDLDALRQRLAEWKPAVTSEPVEG